VVLTGRLPDRRPGEWPYLRLSAAPEEAGGREYRVGRPPYAELGREISFTDLPEACRRVVRAEYGRLWNLVDE
jgi:hypothetical protein